MRATEMAIAELREKYPKRKIIYLDKRDNWRFRCKFNMDVLRQACLDSCDIDVTFFEDFVALSHAQSTPEELLHRLIVKCAIVTEASDTGVRLYAYGSTCEIMSAICRILSEFEE